MDLDVTTEALGAVRVVRIAGKLDTNTAEVFDTRMRELLDGGDVRLVLDLAGVSYMSSMGLRSLGTLVKTVKAKSGSLALAAVPPRVKEVLDIVAFTPLFVIAPTVEEAIASMA
jgi:anti-sigma B factor antagonist